MKALTGMASSTRRFAQARNNGVFPGIGEVPGDGTVEFFQQQGYALTAPAPVADRIIDADFIRTGPVTEKYLYRITNGAFIRVVIVRW